MLLIGTCFLILITLNSPKLSIQSFASCLQLNSLQQANTGNLYDFKGTQKQTVENNYGTYRINGKVLDQNNYENIQYGKYKPKLNKRLAAREDLREDNNGKHRNCNNKLSLAGRFSTNEKLNDAFNTNYLHEMDLIDNQYVSSHNYIKNEGFINPDGDYGNNDNEIIHFIAPKITYSNAQIYRREVPANVVNNINMEKSSLYPSVLTKALKISLSPSASTNTGEGLLANVAQKLNTSTLDLAEKLTKSQTAQNNEQFAHIVQSYLTKNANPINTAMNSPPIPTAENPAENLQKSEQKSKNNQEYLKNEEHFEDIATSSLTAILDRVLNKLESLHDGGKNEYEEHPDGAPCDIIGSWTSTTLGLCFEIQLQKDKLRYISPAEINNKILSITVVECTPAKHHQIIDLDWKFTGSALKQWGGPFYIYGQKRNESVAATFLGFCRTCGGIDTIFGSWNFLSPSKDCNDISLAFEVKRDILRRISMEMKRKERFKDLLYQSRHGKT